ncbi:MAG: N-glycosylase/DNA lyase [Spirochaetes bacterium]|nr:N-glycosylase/DNA lyase [Spirochaetota bacterium]
MNLNNIYDKIKIRITERIDHFKNVWLNSNDEVIFAELVFCILTPQSKARICWKAVERLIEKNLLLSSDQKKISDTINDVRFKNNKAKYIISARELFYKNRICNIKEIINDFNDPITARDWLVNNVKGIAYKEASHFLRNIGFGEKIAILDRHILRNLKVFEIIESIPQYLSRERYIEIENKLLLFAHRIKIKPDHLDFVLWYKATNDIFK